MTIPENHREVTYDSSDATADCTTYNFKKYLWRKIRFTESTKFNLL